MIGGEVVEAGPERHHAIGAGDGLGRERRRKGPEDAQVEGGAPEPPLRLQRRGQRRTEPVGQPDERVTGAGRHRAPAGEDDGPRGRGDDADRPVEGLVIGHRHRQVVDPRGGHVVGVEPLDVDGHVQHDRAALATRPAQGGGDVDGDRVHGAHRLEAGSDRSDQRPLVDVLEVVGVGGVRVAGDEQQRSATAHALDQGGHGVRERRAVGDGPDADLAARPGVSEGHQRDRRLVGGGHVADAVLAHQAIGDEEVGISDQAEDRVDPLVDQRPGDDVMSPHGFPRSRSPMMQPRPRGARSVRRLRRIVDGAPADRAGARCPADPRGPRPQGPPRPIPATRAAATVAPRHARSCSTRPRSRSPSWLAELGQPVRRRRRSPPLHRPKVPRGVPR